MLPSGEGSRRLLDALPERREHLDHAIGASRDRIGVPCVGVRAGVEVLANRQAREDRFPARNLDEAEPDALGRIDVRDRPTIEPNGATIWHTETGDRAQQCRLPGTIRTKERDDLSRPDVDVDVEQHLDVSVAEIEVAYLQRRDLAALADTGALTCFFSKIRYGQSDVAPDEA